MFGILFFCLCLFLFRKEDRQRARESLLEVEEMLRGRVREQQP